MLNGPYRLRTILLTARELEPWFIYDRAEVDLGRHRHSGMAEDLAAATAMMYFNDQPKTT
jgi:hypothetical protein